MDLTSEAKATVFIARSQVKEAGMLDTLDRRQMAPTPRTVAYLTEYIGYPDNGS